MPTPACASNKPYQARGWRPRRRSQWPSPSVRRCRACAAALATDQPASHRPSMIMGEPSRSGPGIASGSTTAVATLTPNATRSRRARSGMPACFQRAMGPTPIRKMAGVINGTKTASK
ncbi:hypothetical protein G6F62_014640 [Rhizopus arrhizus]|nr:hypothetical protein G6F22_019631 [Rhizopus arrhizus]KAG1310346.1 hypothetical protein G6F62_014640 [Rhizopus arrhizus]